MIKIIRDDGSIIEGEALIGNLIISQEEGEMKSAVIIDKSIGISFDALLKAKAQIELSFKKYIKKMHLEEMGEELDDTDYDILLAICTALSGKSKKEVYIKESIGGDY